MWGALAGIIGSLLGGAGKGAAQERTNRNDFQQRQNALNLQQYGTQQQALLSALLGNERGALDRYQTQQGATTAATQGQQAGAQRALEARSGEGLQRARLGLEAPTARARQSLLGSLMANMQPVEVSGGNARVMANMPKITGGMTPAAIDPTTRQHGKELMNAALMAQLSGSDVPKATNFGSGVADWKSSVLGAPEATDMRQGLLPPPNLAGYQQAGRGESFLSGAGVVGGILGPLLEMIEGRSGGGRHTNYPIDPMGGG